MAKPDETCQRAAQSGHQDRQPAVGCFTLKRKNENRQPKGGMLYANKINKQRVVENPKSKSQKHRNPNTHSHVA